MRASCFVGIRTMLSPSSSTEPDWAGSSRESVRSRVDLPQALAPTMTLIPPGRELQVDAVDDGDLPVSGVQILRGEGADFGHDEPPSLLVRMRRKSR